ncbi:MAG: PAS domain-containing protein [Rhodospirillaceae bacterium]|jgi:two-component system, NtrC family, nitrogen regulation sensor histidine kinase GlnL|nr:PAS domain-containing protein [Rhodospirillaceae bacterium]MBT5245021.1 PAS domain-containing protein [Rhodospirillaceae bacterium]MBT5561093.1 PAS domain-containing protein [Rhodospirillaceae bacterium]MBT6241022.1 PAS domain-containing protein [Rhodospirillaceae bacterium]
MGKTASLVAASGEPGQPDFETILNALASSIAIIDIDNTISYVNNASEQFFQGSASHLVGLPIDTLIPADSPILSLLQQVRSSGTAVSEYGLPLETPRIGKRLVNIHASLMPENTTSVVLAIQERSIADTIDRHLTHRGAARSVSAMAAMLAHEVKNPLSGIRGAAQLLESNVMEADKELARLIRDEADRIVALVDRMDIFTDGVPLDYQAVNIHQVLDRVRKLGESGFAQHVRFVENYDPSLPAVLGNRDQLVQVFLNLIKNAAEATTQNGGEIVLTTAYQHGFRFAVPGSNSRVHLPLMVSVQDNGEGIPEENRRYLFDPFVTTKPKGSGLGLALVAKIIDDHGGIVELDSHPSRTVFRVMLPTDTSQTGEG